jgi:hypothetical protein
VNPPVQLICANKNVNKSILYTSMKISQWIPFIQLIYVNKSYTNNEVLFGYKNERNYVICRKVDGAGDYHVKWNKSDSQRQILCFVSYVKSRNLD